MSTSTCLCFSSSVWFSKGILRLNWLKISRSWTVVILTSSMLVIFEVQWTSIIAGNCSPLFFTKTTKTRSHLRQLSLFSIVSFRQSVDHRCKCYHPVLCTVDSHWNLLFRRARALRNEDRILNKDRYPSLACPEIYLLEGGYKGFFEGFRVRIC